MCDFGGVHLPKEGSNYVDCDGERAMARRLWHSCRVVPDYSMREKEARTVSADLKYLLDIGNELIKYSQRMIPYPGNMCTPPGEFQLKLPHVHKPVPDDRPFYLYEFTLHVMENLYKVGCSTPTRKDISRRAGIGLMTRGGHCEFYASLIYCTACRYKFKSKVYIKYASAQRLHLLDGQTVNHHDFCFLSSKKVFSEGEGWYRLSADDVIVDGWPIKSQALLGSEYLAESRVYVYAEEECGVIKGGVTDIIDQYDLVQKMRPLWAQYEQLQFSEDVQRQKRERLKPIKTLALNGVGYKYIGV